MRRNYESEVAQANAIARRSLAGDRNVWVSDYQLLRQRNQTRHTKNYEPRSLRFTSGAKASRAFVVEVCHHHHLAATPARRRCAKTFGAWEGGNFSWWLTR